MIGNREYIGVFLDRDGTISEEVGYILEVSEFSFYDYSAKAIIEFNKLGVKVVVVTNQACVARGLCGEDRINEINSRMIELLEKEGAHIDDVFFCPHHPDGNVEEYAIDCSCRKPKKGMVLKTLEKYDIDIKNSYIVGDKMSDIELGYNSGAKTVLVLTGYGKETLNEIKKNNIKMPNFIAENLLEASDIICKEIKNIKI